MLTIAAEPGTTMKVTAEHRRWSRAVRERDDWTCRRCHKQYPPPAMGLDAHHIFTKSRKSTAQDVQNGVSLCVGCHRSWAHAYPLEFHEWIKDELGAELYDDLQARSRTLRRTGT